ncbi:MAG TPA: hypothetical protein VFL13_00180, partial [Candidatus Baltobacteraceae bacterium]|nr:hypothetical protein [Candidatus Baltobacteraceae bacterium]
MKQRFLVCAALLITAAFSALPAAADTPSIGITVNVANGVHEEPSGSETVPVVPAPVIDLRIPFERFQLRAETLPPLGPIGYGGSAPSLQSTKIGYASGMLYYSLTGTTRVGAGTTLLDQISHYAYARGSASANIDDASRVAGLRLGIEQSLFRYGTTTFFASVEASPAMHAPLHSDGTVTSGIVYHVSQTAAETAALVDTQLRAERQAG